MTAALSRERWALTVAAVLGAVLAAIAVRWPIVAVVGLLGAVVLALVITRPKFLLLVMVAALPWENKLGFPTPTLSLIKGIGALVMLAYLLRLFSHRRTVVRLPALLGVVTLLGLWIGLSEVVSPDPVAGLAKILRYALFFAFFFLVVQLVEDRDDVRRVLRWFAASVAAAAVYGLWLFLVVHSDSRAAGPVEDPNDFAYMLAVALPVTAYLIGSDRRRRWIWIVAFGLIAGAMLATFSRGALVGIGALVLWALVTRRVPLWSLAAAVVGVAAVLALALTVWRPIIDVAFQQKQHIAQANTASRESYWAAALQLTARRPLTGVGPARYPDEAPAIVKNNPIVLARPVTHNSYLEILSENGVPALLLFAAYLALTWRLLTAEQRRAAHADDTDARRIATALQASLIIAIVSATFLSEQLTSPFWLLGGLAAVLGGLPATAPREEQARPPETRTVAPAAPPPPTPPPAPVLVA